jgi:hypothetical protein
VLDIRIEVPIDAVGRPDVEALKVTGQGATDNRDVIRNWLLTARFQPAQHEGKPVPGVYRDRFIGEIRRRYR